MRLTNIAALVMHIRPYRETSAMVRFFTREQGVLVAVAQGARKANKAAHLQPFNFGKLSCTGRGSLMTLTQFEATGHFALRNDALSAGFYVLELIDRCLAEHQVEEAVFGAVQTVLTALAHDAPLAPTLRVFETQLLQQLGYGVDFKRDTVGQAIQDTQYYAWQADLGFAVVEECVAKQGLAQIPGRVLLALADGGSDDGEVLRFAKLINQAALRPLLGSKPLVSRALYSGTHPQGQLHG